jgi:hypothetical protein
MQRVNLGVRRVDLGALSVDLGALSARVLERALQQASQGHDD